MTNDQEGHEHDLSDASAAATDVSDLVPAGQPDRRKSEAERGGSDTSLLGEMVGSIRVVEYLGKGGFGEVYAGVDEKLNRRVALKILRSDRRMEAEGRARFLREARMLSQLDHPNICRIYDLVATKDRDILILELLTGISLAARIKRECPRTLKLAIAEQVARALAAAHEKGIVHRDLKPENVMITSDDTVKVLDFGLARPHVDPLATSLDLGDTAPDQIEPGGGENDGSFDTYAWTRVGAVTGTPGYMSPEQARGEPATPASDIYSFGLLVQELFSGRPAVKGHLTIKDLIERASRGETRPFDDQDRDLVALVARLKSMAPASRPLALDAAERLQWIAHKPGRFKLRLLAAGIAAVLVVTTTVAVIQGLRASRAAVRAEREAQTARQVSEFLTSIFKVSDPGEARGRTITAREILDTGSKKIQTELKDQPLVQARLMSTMGTVYTGLGLYKDAEPLLSSALAIREKTRGPNHSEVGESLNDLGTLYWHQGKYAEAEPLFVRALDVRQKILGPVHPEVAKTLNALADLYEDQGKYAEAEPLYTRALAIREKAIGPGDKDVADTLNSLALLYYDQRRYAEAEPVYKRALAIWERTIGLDHPDVATGLNNLAVLYRHEGRYAEAEPLYKQSLAIWEKVLGSDHPDVATSLMNLAHFYRIQGRYAEAEPLYTRALAIDEVALGRDHPNWAKALTNLADLYCEEGKHAAAEPLYTQVLAIREKAGPRSRETAETLQALTSCELKRGRLNGAHEHSARCLLIGRELTAKLPEDKKVRFLLGSALLLKGQIEAARGDGANSHSSWEEALSVLQPIANDGEGVSEQDAYARALLCLGRAEEAMPIVKKLLDSGYKNQDLLALCREQGLIPEKSPLKEKPGK